MSKRIAMAAFLCAGLAAACGGSGSGVSSGKELTALSDVEIEDLCAYLVGVEGDLREIDCGDIIVTVGKGTVDECIDDLEVRQSEYPSCDATVGDFEACSEDFAALSDDEVCDDSTLLPVSCEPLLLCGGP